LERKGRTLRDALRLLGALAALAGVATVAALLQPEWAADLGLDAFRCPATVPAPDEPAPGEFENYMARQEAKRRVAGELLDGRLTVFEAAALFREINQGGPRVAVSAGDSEEDFLCRQAITWARAEAVPRLEWLPAGRREPAADACVAPLWEQLHLGKDAQGAVPLPEVAGWERYLRPEPEAPRP
jgi:hypothetical protein